MNRIARFEKVSKDLYIKALLEDFTNYTEKEAEEIYDAIKLPKRATKGSAGYDFYAPFSFQLKPNETIKIPTGIRAWMEEDWVLNIYPRSGLGFKHHVRLANSVGIIDSDYYHADNEGHIMVKLVSPVRSVVVEPMEINAGDRIFQGVFMPYGITVDDDIDEVRYGEFGSTGN